MELGAFFLKGYGTAFFFLEQWRCKQLQSKTLVTGGNASGAGISRASYSWDYFPIGDGMGMGGGGGESFRTPPGVKGLTTSSQSRSRADSYSHTAISWSTPVAHRRSRRNGA